MLVKSADKELVVYRITANEKYIFLISISDFINLIKF